MSTKNISEVIAGVTENFLKILEVLSAAQLMHFFIFLGLKTIKNSVQKLALISADRMRAANFQR